MTNTVTSEKEEVDTRGVHAQRLMNPTSDHSVAKFWNVIVQKALVNSS